MELQLCWCIIALCVTTSMSVDYKDLENLGVSCKPRDTCKRSRGNFSDTNCECDNLCLYYDDCCVDGPKPTRRNKRKKLAGLTCVPFLPDQGVYAFSTCSSSWSGSEDVKRKCEVEDDLSDPLMSVPVTVTRAKKTYRSQYCAECNNVDTAGYTLWNPTLTCDSLAHSDYSNVTQEFIVENIVRVGGSWGVHHWNKSLGGMSFFPCDVRFSIPPSATGHVRYCRPYVVSKCAPDWNRELAREECDSYQAVVYSNGVAYRNAHCALCNHVPTHNAKCRPERIDFWKLNFVVLLKVQGGNQAGASSRCPSAQMYDKFLKKCRRIVCPLPDHVPKNGKCVQK